jgi:hypothetical protein
MIVVPNAIAASSVTLNLTGNYAPWPLTISLRLSRDADIEAARQLAIKVATESAGEQCVLGCFLTKVDAAAITLELRLRAEDAAGRDALRSKLLGNLPSSFIDAKIGSIGAELPAFA